MGDDLLRSNGDVAHPFESRDDSLERPGVTFISDSPEPDERLDESGESSLNGDLGV